MCDYKDIDLRRARKERGESPNAGNGDAFMANRREEKVTAPRL